MAQLTGSVLTYALSASATPGAQSITVPSDAAGVLMFWCQWVPNIANQTLTSLTSDFADTFTIDQLPSSNLGDGKDGVGVAYARVTSTGAGKSFTPVWSNAPDAGPTWMVAFVKDIPADPATWVRDTDTRQDTSGSSNPSGSVSSTATDLVLAYDSCDGSSVPGNQSGWTSQQTQVGTAGTYDLASRLRSANSPGASTTGAASQGTGGYATLAMISVINGGGAVIHDSTGSLIGQGATIAGSAARTRAHAGSGVLTGQGSSLSGVAARTRQHAASGVLEGQGSALAGSAARTRQHASSGDLTGPGASLSGAAARTRQHGASGDLLGPGAVIVGAADHTSPAGNHDATGALVGQGSTLSGAAARTRAFASSGALVGPGAVVAGSAARSGTPVSHDASGALVGSGSIVSGAAQVGEDQALVGGFLWMLRRRKAWEDALKSVPEPVAEVIKAEAPKVIEKPKAQARNELRKALELENLPYRAAYTQALERLVQQMRQEQEDDEEEESVAEALLYIL